MEQPQKSPMNSRTRYLVALLTAGSLGVAGIIRAADATPAPAAAPAAAAAGARGAGGAGARGAAAPRGPSEAAPIAPEPMLIYTETHAAASTIQDRDPGYRPSYLIYADTQRTADEAKKLVEDLGLPAHLLDYKTQVYVYGP